MNILLCSCTHWWNAEAHYAAILHDELRAAGHQVWVLTQPGTRHAENLAERGVTPITDIPVWTQNPLRWPGVRNQLARFLREHDLQIVDVFRSKELPLALWAASASGARVVRTRGNARPVRGHWINRRMHRACGGLIASANVLRDDMVRSLGLLPHVVRTIYFPADAPLDWSEKERATHRAALLDALRLPPDRVLFAIVGRVFPEKGHAR
ncbi:MAG TPA: glycosyltransferase, partial [bacterium]